MGRARQLRDRRRDQGDAPRGGPLRDRSPIGPAGEALAKAAGIAISDPKGYPNRFAGRGGLGAVMGSKGLKAIVISDKGASFLEHADKEAFVAATKRLHRRRSRSTASRAPACRCTAPTCSRTSSARPAACPPSNFSCGTFEFADAIGGETQRATIVERSGGEGINEPRLPRPAASIKCSRYWMDKDGHYKTKGPEYETAWSMGADCGINDLDDIAELDRACGDLGLDTIEMGATLAVYMESGAIEFGDAAGALAALKDGLEGKVLWDGGEATGAKFGRHAHPGRQAPVLPAYDPRSVQGIGVTYATSTQGADHTAGYTITANILGVGGTVDPL